MIFDTTPLAGVFIIEPERYTDERGFFARTWCAEEFAAKGLCTSVVQCSVSFNRKRGTLRGMHYQAEPHGENKWVRCTRGAVYDVVLDMRPESATFGKWIAVELSEENRRTLYLPEGVAHGFQSLVEATEVYYQMSTVYVPSAARGIRWNDPAFAIDWPIREGITMSERDASYPDYRT